MYNNQKESSHEAVMVIFIFINAIILKEGFATLPGLYWLLWITVPIMFIAGLWKRRLPKKVTGRKDQPGAPVSINRKPILRPGLTQKR
jgi:hypothetical protein